MQKLSIIIIIIIIILFKQHIESDPGITVVSHTAVRHVTVTLVHALIASRLDYCNSVFYQLSAANLQAMQSVLNAGARLIMRKRKYDHITSTLRDDLHWLPIRQWIMYKLSTIVYKCMGQLHLIWRIYVFPVATNTSRRYLRSATHGDLLVPRTRTVTYGPRNFAVSGPTVWNTLPSTLRVSTTTLGQF